MLRFFRDEVWPQRKQMGWAVWVGCVAVWLATVIGGFMGPLEAFKFYRLANKVQSAWEKSFWRTSQMGWKTVGGAIIAAVAMALYFLEAAGVCEGCEKIGDGVLALGAALGFVGLRHAVAKLMTALPKGDK